MHCYKYYGYIKYLAGFWRTKIQKTIKKQYFDILKTAMEDETQSTQNQPAPAAQNSQGETPGDTASSGPKQQSASADPSQTPPMPQIADDTDLIEKEWVDKAKEVVARTAQDPHLQSREINKIRADYLRKRYNKDIRQSD